MLLLLRRIRTALDSLLLFCLHIASSFATLLASALALGRLVLSRGLGLACRLATLGSGLALDLDLALALVLGVLLRLLLRQLGLCRS